MHVYLPAFRLLSTGLFLTLLVAPPTSSIAAGMPSTTAGDAIDTSELNDIFFLDPDRGWAVGDRGAIWQTQDGGRHWAIVDSPTTGRLESVFFVDELHGWIVGGINVPYVPSSSAVVLRTSNGGRKWIREESPTLPGLKWVWFHDARNGWAVGNSSAIDPAGVFRTSDGGRAWQSIPSAERRTMITAAHGERPGAAGPVVQAPGGDRTSLLCVDRESRLWSCHENRLEPLPAGESGARHARALDMDGRTGWLAGDGGLVMCTRDGGASWQSPRRPLPESTGAHFDFRAVEVRGDRCWLAGSPGTCVFYTDDFGATWQKSTTGVVLPLNGLKFLNEQHGWAVGACGTILATRDGGRTWRTQRQGGQRVALAAIFGFAQDVPWELIAHAAGDEGHYVGVQLLYPPHSATDFQSTYEDRCRDAVALVGATACDVAWRFPVDHPQATESVDEACARWEGADAPAQAEGQEGRGSRNRFLPSARVEEYLVRQIRIWRPDVIVTDPISPDGSRPLSHLASQMVVRASQIASDPASYPDHLLVARLQPWSVKKVYTAATNGQRGPVSIDTERIDVHLGCSLADYSLVSRGLVSPSWSVAPGSLEFRLARSEVASPPGRHDLFGGVMQGVPGESRRSPRNPVISNFETLGYVMKKHRQFLEAALGEDAHDFQGGSIAEELELLTQGLSPHHAGILLQRSAQELAAANHYAAAAETLTSLVERYPQHVLAESSLLWLLDFHVSQERRQFAQNRSPASVEQIRAVSDRLKQTRLALYHEPAMQLRLVSALRRLDESRESDRLLQVLSNGGTAAGWKNCIRGEQWLMNPAGRPPRPVVECREVFAKPYLNAKMDDELWQQADVLELVAAEDAPVAHAEMWVAHDEEYLFFALKCAKDASCDYSTASPRRARDADMNGHDHVEILLDVDRDYATFFRLSVDHRGWTRDDCCGDERWNPQWHVAAAIDEKYWFVEAAVPFKELASAGDAPRAPWSMAVLRPLSHGRMQTWAPRGFAVGTAAIPVPPVMTAPPASSGYMIFP